MNEKETQAIQYWKKMIEICMENANICDENDYDEEATHLRKEQIMIETVLNLIEKQQAEIEKYKMLLARTKAQFLNDTIETDKKNKEDLEMLYKGCQAELEKKDKIINLMSECMEQTGTGRRSFSCMFRQDGECNESGCKICIKQYFERKIEQ